MMSDQMIQILDAKSPYFCRISVEARCFWTPVPCDWQGGRLDFLSTVEKMALEELEAIPVVSMVVLLYVLSWSDDWMIFRQVNLFSNRRFLMNLFERRITSESNMRNLRILWKTCFQFEQWDWLLVNPAFFHDLFPYDSGKAWNSQVSLVQMGMNDSPGSHLFRFKMAGSQLDVQSLRSLIAFESFDASSEIWWRSPSYFVGET